MISLSIATTMSDGVTGTYAVTPRVQVAFEREFDTSIVTAFSSDPKLEHLYWLGWKSMDVAKATTLDFDAWLDDVNSVSPEEGDDAPLGRSPSPT